MNKTSIEWTHRPETGGETGGFTWNPIRARLKGQGPKVRGGTFCTRISPGCTKCYASVINKRFGNGLEYTVPNLDNVEFYINEKILVEPLKRKKPATIFVGDMFDLFHEAIPIELIAEVLRVAWKIQWHTFQFLTKRADRMQRVISEMLNRWGESPADMRPNMWLGVSVESQKYADERIPLLLQTPAAVRFLSVEPMLEAVDLEYIGPLGQSRSALGCRPCHWKQENSTVQSGPHTCHLPRVDWVICGGESGPGARPFNLAWAESLLTQCRAAGVPCFVKQLGSNPVVHSCRNESCTHPDYGIETIRLKDRKGGDPAEWPEHLRVREFPTVEKLVTA